MLRKLIIIAAMAMVSLSSTSPHAWATSPGANGWLAYVDENEQLTLVLPDGSREHEITSFAIGKFVENPQFSANGHWIVFEVNDGGTTDLYVIRTDGSHRHRITHTRDRYEWGPSWSPDGRSIVFSKNGFAVPSPIVAIDRDGTHRRRIGHVTGEFPRYPPNGSRIAYGGSDGEIHVMHADGTHDVILTETGNNNYPDWSPDGRLIAFIRGRHFSRHQVWIMRADGTHDRRVTTTRRPNFLGVFSPNGKQIAYTSETLTPIRVTHLDGTQRHRVGGTLIGDFGVSWQARP